MSYTPASVGVSFSFSHYFSNFLRPIYIFLYTIYIDINPKYGVCFLIFENNYLCSSLEKGAAPKGLPLFYVC